MSTEPSVEPTAILQRETILPTSDRGRLAAIIATCSMAGLAGGMALSMLAESQRVADEMRREQLKASLRLADREAFRSPQTWLGLNIEDVGGRCGGARVTNVILGSPADRAGFELGDIVKGFGGDRVCDDDHLIAVVRASSVGATPSVSIERRHAETGVQTMVLQPKLGVMPPRYR